MKGLNMDPRGFSHEVSNRSRELATLTLSGVFETIQTLGVPSTVNDVYLKYNQDTRTHVSEQTVRKCIHQLVKAGMLVKVDKRHNAQLFEVSAQYKLGKKEPVARQIPYGNTLVSVYDFIQLMANPDGNPFRTQTKTPLITEEMSNAIRQRMLFVVLSADETGFEAVVARYQKGLALVESELTRILKLVSAFNRSLVWHDMYRDELAKDVGDLRNMDPDLYRLAHDFVQNLAGDK